MVLAVVSGVYAIIHRDSGRWYVGQSKSVKNRWKEHRNHLRRGTHRNSRIQSAWDRYGEDAFDFVILILAPIHLLNDLEQAYLDDPETSHFNIARCAEASARGRKHSPEHRAKLSASLKGHQHTAETRAKIGAVHRGRKMSPEAIEKMAASRRGKALTDDHKAKIGAANKGRVFSDGHREKLSEARKGRKLSPEHRAKIGASQLGRKLSPETRSKISAANTGRTPAPETIAKRIKTMKANRQSRS